MVVLWLIVSRAEFSPVGNASLVSRIPFGLSILAIAAILQDHFWLVLEKILEACPDIVDNRLSFCKRDILRASRDCARSVLPRRNVIAAPELKLVKNIKLIRSLLAIELWGQANGTIDSSFYM